MRIAITLILILPLSLFAQEKKIRAVEKHYRKGNHEKVITLASKAETRYPGEPAFPLYTSKSKYRMYRQSRRKPESQLNELLDDFRRAKDLSSDGGSVYADTVFIRELRKTLGEKVNTFKGKTSDKATYYTEYLASVLFDTIAYYHQLHPRPTPAPATTFFDTVTVEKKKVITKDFFRKPRIAPHRDSVVSFARRFIGTPYKWAGETPAGFDCSGYVLYIMRKFGYDFYHKTTQIAKLGTEVPIAEAKKGDILVFGYRESADKYHVSHVGILAEDGADTSKVIHSVNRGVSLDDLEEGHWSDKILFVRRIID